MTDPLDQLLRAFAQLDKLQKLRGKLPPEKFAGIERDAKARIANLTRWVGNNEQFKDFTR